MRITSAAVTPVRLRLAKPLATAHGEITAREGAVLTLTSDADARGCGEALPLPGFGLEDARAAARALEAVAQALVGGGERSLDEATAIAARCCGDARSARAAADVALHDLAARERGVRCAELLATAWRERVAVSALLPGAEPGAAAEQARAAVARGFRTLKLKLAAGDLARDEERVAAVRAAVGPAVRLRLDANAGWKEADAAEAALRLAQHDIEFLEQPVADLAALARLRAGSPIRVAADEAVRDERAAAAALAAGAADVLVVKPATVGGLGPARRIVERAGRAGVDVVVTSLLDSTLGIAAALALAATCPENGGAAGLATAALLSDDLAAPIPIANGEMIVPAAPGLGVSPEWLARCASDAPRRFSA